MRTTQERIYKVYTPLSLSVTIDNKGTQLKQSFKQDETGDAAYTPNRRLTPSVILPVVRAYDKDGVFRTGVINDLLSDIHWYEGNTEIIAGADYGIDTSNTQNKGQLTIYKNTPVGSSFKLRFVASIADTRRNEVIKVYANNINIPATVASGDEYNITLNVPSACYYNPLDNEASLTVNATGWRGDKGTSALTYELRKTTVSGSIVSDRAITDTDFEIISVSGNAFAFDIRMINEESYIIIGKVDGYEVARTGFTIKRKYPSWTAKQVGTPEIIPGQAEVAKRCIIEASTGVVDNPLSFFSILAFTTSLKKGEMNWGEREELRINPYDAGFVDSSYLGMYFEVNELPALDVGTDEDGNFIIDEETGNNFLI